MPGLLGKKIGMTSVFSADGKNVPCTVIEAGPCVVTQVKTVEKDGYAAVQLGFQDKKEKHTTKPLMGHFKRAGVTPKRHLAEFKEFETELNLGDTVTVELFNDANFVDVVGTSKGKGFQGVVRRQLTASTIALVNRVLSVLVLTLLKYLKECVWVDNLVVTESLYKTYRY